MRNRVTNYLTKVSNNQIKAIVDRQKFIENEQLCEAAMEELKAVYWHEKELLIVIPMLISNATTFELVETLTVHIKYIREHIKDLEKRFPNIHVLSPPKKNLQPQTHYEETNTFEQNMLNVYSINTLKNTVLR